MILSVTLPGYAQEVATPMALDQSCLSELPDALRSADEITERWHRSDAVPTIASWPGGSRRSRTHPAKKAGWATASAVASAIRSKACRIITSGEGGPFPLAPPAAAHGCEGLVPGRR